MNNPNQTYYFQEPLPEKSLALGEISLTGQIKPINNIGQLVKEAEKFGITTLLIAKNQTIEKTSCTVKRFHNVYELLSLFGQQLNNYSKNLHQKLPKNRPLAINKKCANINI